MAIWKITQGSSPHTRGARAWSARPARPAGIIPAYAGSTTFAAYRDHGMRGSSPHTRGALFLIFSWAHIHGIIPAYAGSTGPGVFDPPRGRDHPRIRGEHHARLPTRVPLRGSSPHTRGALVCHDMPLGPVTDHPRIRGEHGLVFVDPCLACRIIPAYAGSTLPARARWTKCEDHPRIRGEHRRWFVHFSNLAGSSPHTRGAHIVGSIRMVIGWIIPAYAGSTPVACG